MSSALRLVISLGMRNLRSQNILEMQAPPRQAVSRNSLPEETLAVGRGQGPWAPLWPRPCGSSPKGVDRTVLGGAGQEKHKQICCLQSILRQPALVLGLNPKALFSNPSGSVPSGAKQVPKVPWALPLSSEGKKIPLAGFFVRSPTQDGGAAGAQLTRAPISTLS